nr:InlB B-repeat-containing protein [Gammaproteobacteria bacterium]
MKHIKKIIAIVLTIAISAILVGCKRTIAPISTTKQSPVTTTTETPVTTTTTEDNSDVTTTTEEPVITTTEEPVITTTEEPVITTTEEPVITTTEEPVITTTNSGNNSSSETTADNQSSSESTTSSSDSNTETTSQIPLNQYTVSFDGNVETYDEGEALGALPSATKVGYQFLGWYNGDTKVSEDTIVNSNLTLVSKFEIITYTITYKLDGGVNDGSNPSTYTINTETITLKDATKEDYNFIGWYSDSEYKNEVETINKGSTGNLNLYAKFEAQTYTITYNLDGGTNDSSNPSSYTKNSETITLKDASKDYYDFKGWYSDSEFNTKVESIAKGSKGNITLYAKFELKSYLINENEMVINEDVSEGVIEYKVENVTFTEETTLSVKDSSNNDLTEGLQFRYYKEVNGVLTIVTEDSYTVNTSTTYAFYFKVYNPDTTDETVGTVWVEAVREYTVNIAYEIDEEKVVVAHVFSTDNAKVEDINATIDNENKKVTFRAFDFYLNVTMAILNEGEDTLSSDWTNVYLKSRDLVFSNYIASWTNRVRDENGNVQYDLTTTKAIDIENKTIVVHIWNSNNIEGTKEDTYYVTINNLNITIKAKEDHDRLIFIILNEGETVLNNNWTNIYYRSPELQINDYIASWDNEVKVSFNSNGGSLIREYSIAFGSVVSAPTAPTKDGYNFVNWYKESALENVYDFSSLVLEDITLYAKWETKSYSISYDLAGGSLATANPTSYTIESNSITLNNPTKEGYHFAGWTGTGLDSASTNVSIAQGSIGDRSYTAVWTLDCVVSYNANTTDDVSNLASSAIVKEGENHTVSSLVPVRVGYTFASWNTKADGTGASYASGDVIENLEDDVTLYAIWNINKYTITWKNGDTILETDENVPYGTIPTYNGNTPTKASTETHFYTHKEWDSEVVAVEGDTTYTATFYDYQVSLGTLTNVTNSDSTHNEFEFTLVTSLSTEDAITFTLDGESLKIYVATSGNDSNAILKTSAYHPLNGTYKVFIKKDTHDVHLVEPSALYQLIVNTNDPIELSINPDAQEGKVEYYKSGLLLSKDDTLTFKNYTNGETISYNVVSDYYTNSKITESSYYGVYLNITDSKIYIGKTDSVEVENRVDLMGVSNIWTTSDSTLMTLNESKYETTTFISKNTTIKVLVDERAWYGYANLDSDLKAHTELY